MTQKIKTSKESSVTIAELMLPSHSNFSGKIHGGYILNLMDQIAFACASKYSGRYCVTASINTVDFVNPIEVGELVTLKARVNYVGRTSMVVGIRVSSENIKTGETKHCNSSYFVMVAKNDDGTNAEVPKLKLTSTDGVRRFVRAFNRLETKKKRKAHFHKDEFHYEDYQEEIKKHNVIVELEDN